MSTLYEKFKEEKINLATEEIRAQFEHAIKKQRQFIEAKKTELFEPYLRKVGIKGELTKAKLNWHGIKLAHKMENAKEYYQLRQRGKNISPVFIVDYSEMEITYNASSYDSYPEKIKYSKLKIK